MTTGALEWAVASQALEPGESGDAFLVHPLPNGALLALVDGVGHGREAAAAARAAIALLAAATETPVETLRRCHAGLQAGRGVALAGVWVDATRDRATWLAVGDIQGALVRTIPGGGVRPLLVAARAGIVGRRLPIVHAKPAQLELGDLLVLATDGIRRDFAGQAAWSGPPHRIADAILARHRRADDDAMVLVARYHGGAS